jgi:hypothetical protein
LNAVKLMRGVLELALGENKTDTEYIVKKLLEVSDRDLANALGFELRYPWTICVYKGDKNLTDQTEFLRCVAHFRSIACEISEARKWPSGVGVAGISYAQAREVVVEDLHAEGLGNVLEIADRHRRSNDRERHVSICSVPILVGKPNACWGVVVGSCSIPGHFSDGDSLGFNTTEPLRVLADMVALGVAACESAASQKSKRVPT